MSVRVNLKNDHNSESGDAPMTISDEREIHGILSYCAKTRGDCFQNLEVDKEFLVKAVIYYTTVHFVNVVDLCIKAAKVHFTMAY